MDNDVLELERQCLEALQHNYPQLLQCNGELLFVAEAESPKLTATAWQFDPHTTLLLKQDGIKSALLETLDMLVAQRKQQRIRPNREGRLVINNNQCQIHWLHEGSAGLVLYQCA
ncbi:hypothetical protein [Rheinheimera maricola]|uniref:Uncharacterized protein n=1 Tax=Rheinheimera maricola TaxID=2793282 RepID=A0ABS7X5D9_9GAMM|nr:hypothetical protein [Rheinheimera maricola]MBZ9610764.1 hypothetical protein [Rheinheimera maricola]